MCFEETLSGRDACHQYYVRVDKSGHYACASEVCVLPNLGSAESEPITPVCLGKSSQVATKERQYRMCDDA